MSKLDHVYNLFGGKCTYCKRRTTKPSMLPHQHTELDATVDHDTPKCRTPYISFRENFTNNNNVVLACRACNQSKADMTGPEFLSFRAIKKLPQSYIEYLEAKLLKRLKL
jgi:5-methylcytosine-specific restriction endonuclease McrA